MERENESVNVSDGKVGMAGKASEGTASSKEATATAEPSLFSKIDSFESCRNTVNPGSYLVAIFGENHLVKSKYNLMVVPCKNTAAEN